MSWNTPVPATTGELYTAARYNTDVIDNLNTLKTSISNAGLINGEIQAVRGSITTLTISSGVISPDVSVSNAFKVTLSANVTSIVVTGWTAAKETTATIRFTQDSTGGRTVAFPAGWKWAGGAAPTITATLNKTDIVVLYSDDGGTTIFASLFTQNA